MKLHEAGNHTLTVARIRTRIRTGIGRIDDPRSPRTR